MDVRNRVVLVTGASAGIGAATARRLAREGARLALVARSAAALAALADELRDAGADALAVPADVSAKAEVERAVADTHAHYGAIDVLINNAGRGAWGDVAVINNDHYREIMELNVFGALYAMQAVVPRMRVGGGGVIVNVSSMVSMMNLPGLASYASTKYALNALSHAARLELAADNIRVVTMYPGRTATDFGKHTLGYDAAQDEAHRGPRPDTAEDVAAKILEGIAREPRDQYMNVGARVFALVSALAPGALDRFFAKQMHRARGERTGS